VATLTAPVPPILKLASVLGANCGQAVGYVAANGGGDFFPCSGQGILLTFKSAGTGATITLDSVILSSYGVDLNPTIVLASTDEQQIFVKNDLRFDQGGVNTGLIAVTYSQVVTVTVRAVTIPGIT
jgi:hypothetical protein